MGARQKHILIIRLSALGDVAMTIPVIYSVAWQYPDTRFTIVTNPFFARLFLNSPSNLSLFIADTKGEYSGLKGLFQLLKALIQLDITHVADLHNVLRSWVITSFFALKGKRVVIMSKGRIERYRLLSHRQTYVSKSYILRYQDVFTKLGLPAGLTFKSLFDGVDNVKTPFVVEENAVGIAPFARYENKIYPLTQMKTVAKALSEHGFYVYLFGGGEKEKSILEEWEMEIKHCYSLVGKYCIEEELAIMSRLKALISMDSANQHLASLVGTRVVSLWGSTTPACGFSGYGQAKDDALCLNLPCQPCSIAGSKKCKLKSHICLCEIFPDVIVENVMENITLSPNGNNKNN